jgi:hypothetical protein
MIPRIFQSLYLSAIAMVRFVGLFGCVESQAVDSAPMSEIAAESVSRIADEASPEEADGVPCCAEIYCPTNDAIDFIACNGPAYNRALRLCSQSCSVACVDVPWCAVAGVDGAQSRSD